RQEIDQYRKKTLTTFTDTMKRGVTLLQRGYLAPARSDFEAASKLDPKSAEALILVAEADAGLGDFAGAREAIRKAFAIKPDDAQVHRGAGFVAMLEPDFAGAIGDFDKVLAKDPKEAYSHQQRIAAYQNLGRLDDAL